MDRLELIERRDSEISVYLSAKIDVSGDLVLEGQDLGSGVEGYWGDSDYEYWVIVKAKNKLKCLLKLTEYAFQNIGKLVEWLDSTGVEYETIVSSHDDSQIVAEADLKQIHFKIHTGGLGIKKLENIITIDRKHENTLLLSLLKHTFNKKLFINDAKFMEWLKGENIEYLFHSYA